METDLGNPIDYDANMDPLKKDEDSTPISDEMIPEQAYYYPSEMMMSPQQQYQQHEKPDFLSNIDKSTWIIAFAVFLLGFFMGKTMQPVILRYT
jgi:hypothetical protein